MPNLTMTSEFKPPMINGVTASKVYLPHLEQMPNTLLDFLCHEFPHIEAKEWQQRFDDQLIMDSNGQILQKNTAYIANQHIYYYRFLANEIHVPFQEKILFENDDLLVVDKPHFLTMSPTGQYVQETLLVRLKKTTQNADLTPIHRLDRETAGVVLFSKRIETRGVYQQMFAERKVQKIYHAIAPYNPKLHFPITLNLRMDKGEPFFTMKIVEGTANSETQIELLEHNDHWAKYQLNPKTGKQHQLRVHLNYLNIPIKNDAFYPTIKNRDNTDFTKPLALLAHQISFIDPINKQEMCFNSEIVLTL
ncbi:pseudouridine synthase [Acinetobacter shaoyimingii]|uniref:Pseudouridylate synthase n=1 Tax=Acinetobacter shaoyimingii TaxID=2715164 RepID=A0A6G8RWD8_9GAMM|nr:pseudouridine synthase [Acinetobacter shaoyimingii]QIO06197.1 pseudouridylate synthase [Acinetobacter shaoyimingii]